MTIRVFSPTRWPGGGPEPSSHLVTWAPRRGGGLPQPVQAYNQPPAALLTHHLEVCRAGRVLITTRTARAPALTASSNPAYRVTCDEGS
jgi:hypothetical protein